MQTKPVLVVGSPRCAPFSPLSNLCKGMPNYTATLEECYEHFVFCLMIYQIQIDEGRIFLHEHPCPAWSWKMNVFQEFLARNPSVQVYRGDRCPCQSGPRQIGDEIGFIKKDAAWCTNCSQIGSRFEKKCPGGHSHINLLGFISHLAEEYCPGIVTAVLEGLVEYNNRAGNLHSIEYGTHCDELPLNEPPEWQELMFDNVFDNIVGMELDRQKVRDARLEEVSYMKTVSNVYFVTDEQYCWDVTKKKPLATGWVDVNKGGWKNAEDRNIRSRFVAKETKWRTTLGSQDPTFASPPPLEGLKLMLSSYMTETLADKYASVSGPTR